MRTPKPFDDVHQRFCQGCPRAFDEVFRRYRPMLKATALRIVRHDSDADDVVQWAFLKAWHARTSVRDASKLKGWLGRVVRNRALEHLRRRQEVSLDRVGFLERGENTVELDLGRVQIEHALGRVLSELTPRQRDVFLLRMTTPMDYDAVGRKLGCSPGSARVHFTCALKRVRSRLKEGGVNG